MNSMTGYGRASGVVGTYTLTIQVSAVNRKTLDLTLKLPPEWAALEPSIGEQVRAVAVRGKVHVDIALTGSGGTAEPAWDETAAQAALDRLAAFAGRQGVVIEATPGLLWEILSAQRAVAKPPPVEEAAGPVAALLGEALGGFAAMRAQEGATLLSDFLARLATLSGHVAAVAERAPAVPSAHREQLLKRLREAGLEIDLADERVLREIALFADRCDITEELTRLGSHIHQLDTLLRSGAEIGRKAEFILQEIGREIHTVGSKANDLEISRRVIELKNELERIREQIANVE